MKKRLFLLLSALLVLTLPCLVMQAEDTSQEKKEGEKEVVLLSSDTAERSEEKILVVNGKHLPILTFHGENYLSLNALCRAIGKTEAEFSVKDGVFTAEIRKGALSASAKEGQHLVIANGRYLYSDHPNIYQDRVLYVPMSSAVKAVGGKIEKVTGRYHYLTTNEGAAIRMGDSYYDEDAVLWLSRIIHAESGNQPLAGKIAVGTVVLNRVDSPKYPDTIYGVIFDKKYGVQFTPTENGSIWCNPNTDSVIAAKIVLEGYRTNPDILFFMNESTAVSTWISDNCDYAFTIADHSFWS